MTFFTFGKTKKHQAWFLLSRLVVIAGGISIMTMMSAHAEMNAIKTENNQSKHKQYQVEDFSDEYKAIVTVDTSQEYEEPVIDIIDKQTGEVILSKPIAIDIDYEIEASKEYAKDEIINANITSFPYGHFSGLIYDDFNFDNKKDLAIKDGRNGCYGGPSYQVYLKQDNQFVSNDFFTDLAQSNCGFFVVDKENQTLHTMTKSGAAWHEYTTYEVVNNKPVVKQVIVETGDTRGFIKVTETNYKNGKEQVNVFFALPFYDNEPPNYLYSYILDNGKKLVLESYDGEHLYYAFLNQNNRIELLYEGEFDYDAKANTLSFYNKPVTYQVSDDGITVKISGKNVVFNAKPDTLRGSLKDLLQYENVSLKN